MVPALAVTATGGLDSVNFWVLVVSTGLAALFLGWVPFGLLLYLPLRLLLEWLDRRSHGRHRWREWLEPGMILGGSSLYFLVVFGDEPLDRLVVHSPVLPTALGAFLIVAGTVSAMSLLFRVAKRIETVPFSAWPLAPREPKRADLVAEPIPAWRSWVWDGSTLIGAKGRRWRSSRFEAECQSCPEVPSWAHTCGVYAFAEPSHLPDPPTTQPVGEAALVVGRVELAGTVIEHEFGYRAAEAVITDLWVQSFDLHDRIGETYPDVRVWLGAPPRVPA